MRFGREAEGYGHRKAASRPESRSIAAVDGGGCVEVIGAGDGRGGAGAAAARDGRRNRRSSQGEALDIVRIHQIGSAQPDLGPVKDGVIADSVVDVAIEGTEGINDGLVVILPIVHPLLADPLVEDAHVQSLALIAARAAGPGP